jgi:hypothetical protein
VQQQVCVQETQMASLCSHADWEKLEVTSQIWAIDGK